MNELIQHSVFLRKVLKTDALLSAITVAVMTFGADVLAPVTGLPADGLRLVGLALIPWVGLLLWVGTRPAVPAGWVWLVIALNGLGAVACAVLAFGASLDLTALGLGFMAVNGVGAAALADLQYLGLRRSAPALA